MDNDFDRGESPLASDISDCDKAEPRFYEVDDYLVAAKTFFGADDCLIAATMIVIHQEIPFESARDFWNKVSEEFKEKTRVKIGRRMKFKGNHLDKRYRQLRKIDPTLPNTFACVCRTLRSKAALRKKAALAATEHDRSAARQQTKSEDAEVE